MRTIGRICSSHGTVDEQPALVHAEYDVENFPYHQELAGGHQVSRLKPAEETLNEHRIVCDGHHTFMDTQREWPSWVGASDARFPSAVCVSTLRRVAYLPP
jgi:hypothetical protein